MQRIEDSVVLRLVSYLFSFAVFFLRRRRTA